MTTVSGTSGLFHSGLVSIQVVTGTRYWASSPKPVINAETKPNSTKKYSKCFKVQIDLHPNLHPMYKHIEFECLLLDPLTNELFTIQPIAVQTFTTGFMCDFKLLADAFWEKNDNAILVIRPINKMFHSILTYKSLRSVWLKKDSWIRQNVQLSAPVYDKNANAIADTCFTLMNL